MNFWCFDTEDDSAELMQSGKSGFDKKVTQIAAISDSGGKFYNKGDVGAFKKFVRKSKEKIFYAHNLQYDLGNIFADELDQLDVVMVGGRLIKALWHDVLFVDSFNMWPMSAKRIGEKFGLKKLEFDAHNKEYVFRDVEIIMAAMSFAWNFAQRMGLEKLPVTLGGMAMMLWQEWGGENCPDSSYLSRAALFGGRVELFKLLNDCRSIAWTDINSLYPYCMTRLFPVILENQFDLTDFGIVHCTIHQPKTDLPVLPFRSPEDGRILYPTGKFTGCWTVEEIRTALHHGAKIEKLHAVQGTNEATRPYKFYMDKIFALRQASTTDAESEFLKLLMNTLYGRLGLSGKITRSVWQTEKNKEQPGVSYGAKKLVEYKTPLGEHVNWAHAAYVSSYGRLELYKYLRMIGAEHLIYCDTDSAIFDCPTKKIPYPTGKELGQMKIVKPEEGNFWFNCETYAPKLYRVKSKGPTIESKAKGVPRNLADRFINQGNASFDLPFKLRESIRFFDRENSHKLSVWRNVMKARQSGYDRKQKKGNRYYPCKINVV